MSDQKITDETLAEMDGWLTARDKIGEFINTSQKRQDYDNLGSLIVSRVPSLLAELRAERLKYDALKKVAMELASEEEVHQREQSAIDAAMREKTDAQEKPAVEYCDRCDGVGWYEGGRCLQTACEKCKGTGTIDGTAQEQKP